MDLNNMEVREMKNLLLIVLLISGVLTGCDQLETVELDEPGYTVDYDNRYSVDIDNRCGEPLEIEEGCTVNGQPSWKYQGCLEDKEKRKFRFSNPNIRAVDSQGNEIGRIYVRNNGNGSGWVIYATP